MCRCRRKLVKGPGSGGRAAPSRPPRRPPAVGSHRPTATALVGCGWGGNARQAPPAEGRRPTGEVPRAARPESKRPKERARRPGGRQRRPRPAQRSFCSPQGFRPERPEPVGAGGGLPRPGRAITATASRGKTAPLRPETKGGPAGRAGRSGRSKRCAAGPATSCSREAWRRPTSPRTAPNWERSARATQMETTTSIANSSGSKRCSAPLPGVPRSWPAASCRSTPNYQGASR